MVSITTGRTARHRLFRLVSLGNQCDLDIGDVFDFFIEDGANRRITIYVEGIRPPPVFALAGRAREGQAPVPRQGGTDRGGRAPGALPYGERRRDLSRFRGGLPRARGAPGR